MTREDIARLWDEANNWGIPIKSGFVEELERFAALVAVAERERTWTQDHWTDYERSIAAAEREACAEVCENEHEQRELYFEQTGNGMPTVGLLMAAAAIRARSEE